jgi:hypothetical protein
LAGLKDSEFRDRMHAIGGHSTIQAAPGSVVLIALV